MKIDAGFAGKAAIVTGGSRGIGRAITLLLASEGADVTFFYRDSAAAEEVVANARAAGSSISSMQVDVRDSKACAAAAEAVAERCGRIDILVNNAGTIARSPALEHGDDQWARVIQTNLTAPFVLARELARPMADRGYGKMIFTASMLSFQGGINVVSYTAAKSGLAGVVRALANEWAPHGVNVNAIAPGYFTTDNTRQLRDDPDRHRAILDRIPAGRWGEPADVAGATVFLASGASDYVHGVVLPVDGGWLAR
jgi:2-deoxy-D-gluconate 3-dehydrogenase